MFLKYTKEIYDIAKARNVDVGIAFTILNADIKIGRPVEGNTEGILKRFSYKKAHRELMAMSDEELTAAYAEITCLLCSPETLRRLHDAYPSRKKMDAVAADWLVRKHQEEEKKEEEAREEA